MALVVTKTTLHQAEQEISYWLTRSPNERIAAVGVMRRRMFGDADASGSRLHEFLESFIEHDVRFLVVGGYALAAHGLPRATGDFDAWVWIDASNARRIVSALADFGFGGLDLTEVDFNREDSVVQLGYPPYRIDILTSIDGVDFEQAWDRRMTVDVDDLILNVIGRDDLIRNKTAAGRPQDLADVDRLRQLE